ncbi:MAG: serine hydrolase [Bacilli bacterium]|jgi:CubicO group peptidase (beta-lactamase class C family)|nr:serine hydrolase [Bacilli bacterium]
MINMNEIKQKIEKLKVSLPSLNIDSIFLEQDGKLDKVFYSEECLHELRSCSKLLVAMAIGIAIDKGMITLDTFIYPSIKNIVEIRNGKNLEKIKKWKIRDLLTHTTGYESQMMSERFIKDIDESKLLDYALNFDIPYNVGTRFAYNNVEPFILSVFFQETFGINLSDFINENIFKKLDIKEYKWDNFGKYCPASTGLYLKHSDFHKIGKLLLNNGKYNDIQVIPETWINEMCTLQLETPSAFKPERVFPKVGVGYYTFISTNNYIFRDGADGQYIIINKEKNLLITIMSKEKEMKNVTKILRNLI